MKYFTSLLGASAALWAAVSAQSIAQINGNKFLSPYQGQAVTNVSGLVTAKNNQGFWLRSTAPDEDSRTSESIFVFSSSAARTAVVGNIVVLNARVTEYRSSSAYLFLTELSSPTNITVLSTGNEVVPRVLGQRGLNPPTQQYSSLDGGDVFAVPNNQSRISVTNPTLQPTQYGLDFWESIMGELVTVRNPRALSKPNQFGDTWVAGTWRTTGNNNRGGLTITDRDANPEAIIIGTPLDGSDNPTDTKLGESLEEITGVMYYAFGFYRILPKTNIKVTGSRQPALPPATRLRSSGQCDGITVGQYNVENLYSGSTNLAQIGDHIANYLRSPDILFVQEIQDDNGPTNDAIVDANVTLSALRDAINAASSRTNYSYVDIDPVDDQDGGQPGGNIRVAYLYNPDVVRLRNPNPGSSTQATEVVNSRNGPRLTYNPGRIEPSNPAWTASRKPLAAHWETVESRGRGWDRQSSTFFTVNVHWTSKGGSSSLHGDPRPPVNGGVDQRNQQANVTGAFISSILRADRNAAILSAGDYNEFQNVQPIETFERVSGLENLDEVVGTPETEQYTYLFDMNSQELDHLFVSPALASRRRAQFEHVHVNTWVSYDDAASDHDPSVARVDVCGGRW
ncbi:hypothetical protein M409DRAFT_59635 [Zasmidium cellare ATCC 36951]|uniref:Endonuclease/exonuclease/phosphatase domain-containing protein n=1 Tax=Zasmidium cellare ATCC 36951 TaxID=1080233 RepID=A0A6A6C533_ZASCE|nr:uncharacterized protein M409DRAFT_59635 [Zasmidium cellare ATCC 36951]KAF2160849.1 hypothetical protein M409DRAFT_59635 [Zasmidium cellare ATCC 36951]